MNLLILSLAIAFPGEKTEKKPSRKFFFFWYVQVLVDSDFTHTSALGIQNPDCHQYLTWLLAWFCLNLSYCVLTK